MSAKLDTLRDMLASAAANLSHDTNRLYEYRNDFNAQPAEDTAAQIRRTEKKITAGQERIEALLYATSVLTAVEEAVAGD